MAKASTFTFPLDRGQQAVLLHMLQSGNFRPATVPYAIAAADGQDCRIVLYQSGKCVVQGKGAEDFVVFTMEPLVLKAAKVGYEDVLHPEVGDPHMGVDESGKGDFFGPLVIAAAYTDRSLIQPMRDLGVKDSKKVTSDKRILEIARELRKMLGHRFALVTIGPAAYNRLYAKIRNVNSILAWGHARAIENLLEKIPDCPRAISDQFGNESLVRKALMGKGRGIKLEQRPRAEEDLAVAAASILARAGFVTALSAMAHEQGVTIPKGASPAVQAAARSLVANRGPAILVRTAKCHFKTTDAVLLAAGHTRQALGPEGAAISRTTVFRRRPKTP